MVKGNDESLWPIRSVLRLTAGPINFFKLNYIYIYIYLYYLGPGLHIGKLSRATLEFCNEMLCKSDVDRQGVGMGSGARQGADSRPHQI